MNAGSFAILQKNRESLGLNTVKILCLLELQSVWEILE
jgi:hypothetical protein